MMNLDVPQLVRADDNDRAADRKMVTLRMYKPPLDGRVDLYKDFDQFVGSRIEEILKYHYPGYPWKCISDAFQGMVYFNIPVLMGATLHWTIRLAEWSDLNPKLVIDGGGEVLERLNLPRTGFDAASFVKARDEKWLADFTFKRRA